MSFFGPVSAFQENVSNCLAPVAAGALVGVGSVDSMEVGSKANFACAPMSEWLYKMYCTVAFLGTTKVTLLVQAQTR